MLSLCKISVALAIHSSNFCLLLKLFYLCKDNEVGNVVNGIHVDMLIFTFCSLPHTSTKAALGEVIALYADN